MIHFLWIFCRAPDMKQVFFLLSVLLCMVSCSPDGQFRCTSGECLPAALVCGFKGDSHNGTDEEFGGSCDFEQNSCGWNQTSGAPYHWKRQMANISSIPGKDHTTGSPSGHVLHFDAKQSGSFSTAKLEYSVDKWAALGCQISFWYHIYDNKSTSSSPLKLTMVRGKKEKELLEILKSKTDGWENATAFIGNQPRGYKLQLSFRPSMHAKKDVMLDDILFENCAEGDVPAGSDRLSCDFETDRCSWYPDFTASLLWKWTKAGSNENPHGDGYYMIITAKPKLNISSTARLISAPQPVGPVYCISFWYHIFGNSIGSLKFIAKPSGEAETVLWMRSGTQGNKWRFADLTIDSDRPIQFIIEAVVGGKQGSIAIDNVIVKKSATGSCPAERDCTFQGSLCGLQPHPSANFSWSRITGKSKPANSSGPATDHTLGTDEGYYLSAQLWSHPVGSTVAVMTAVMEPTTGDGECLMFWYYMEGDRVGELSVYIQPLDDQITQCWTRKGDQGTHWRHGRVTLNTDTTYKVIFEAVVGVGSRRDIAIDDITVLNGRCPPPGFCDFEMDFCGWVNNPPAESGVDWDWLSSQSDVELLPDWDHSTNSALGHFAFFKPFEANREEIAQLESETMEAVDQACLEMWHFVVGWLDEGHSKISLTVLVNETSGLRPVWNRTGYRNDSWIHDRVDYNASGPHQIVLRAGNFGSLHESLSLDDVQIIKGKCCDDTMPTATPTPATTPTTAAPVSTMDCTFEHGLCSWIQDVSDDLNWSLTRGLQVDQPWDGPQNDHTVGNDQGSFLLLNGSGSKDGERAVLSVPLVNLTSQICVGFWYHILGPSVPGLDLLVLAESSEELVWTRRGTQNPEWINAHVTINMNNTHRLIFTGHRNTNSEGFIAIDDITVKEGVCRDQDISEMTCGFDSGWCGFENAIIPKGRWVRQQGSQNMVDHSYGTENGFFMTVVTSNSTQTEVEAQLLTSSLSSSTEICVRFWYWLPASSSNILSVHVLMSEQLTDTIWQRSGAPSADWELAEVTVSSPAKFHVVFKVLHGPGMNSAVKLDDISVRSGACSPPGSCDFESGQCTWVNVQNEHGHDWVLSSGGFQGPPTDHNTQTPEGSFLLSSSLHQNHSSFAQVSSEWIHLKDSASCFTIWYQMDGSHSGTLKVFRRSGPSEEDLMFDTNSSELSWTKFSQTVKTNKPFQLLIVAEGRNRGFIAIDDISLTPGFCGGLGFEGCTFENGTCAWKDISVGQIQWVRGRNGSENTGPSVDNTLDTELGWYMAVKRKRGDRMTPAALQSPTMKQASTSCTLHFYYNTYGDDIQGLNVALKEASRTTTLWWLSGSHQNSWHYGEVTLGRLPQDFTISFEASRKFIKPGHIAIDDIDFTNCSLPEPQPFCPESMFQCNNSVCVEHSRVCDYSDDCGDRSDEKNCDQQRFERCNFEHNLCAWAGSDVDTSEAEWMRHRGQEAWPKHGPPRDHTQNSATGHFVIPGTLTEKGQTSEILSKTLLPSWNCTVRFFFFSLGDSAETLKVWSRTLRSGYDDTVLWLRANHSSYSWQRAVVTFSSSDHSKIVFRYEKAEGPRGLVAVDDISFSEECVFDPENNQLPDKSTTSAPLTSSNTPPPHTTPSTSSSTTPTHPCQDEEFFCWRSAAKVCIPATLQCDYHPDCPQGEDEDGCGPCTFESNQCQWTDTGSGQSRWKRQRASNTSEPPTDHTTDTGVYMRVHFSQGSTPSEARLQSPSLPPSSPYCQIMFHFYISGETAGSLRVLMQQAEGGEAILWSSSHNTVSHWTPEQLPVRLNQQPYTVWFSSKNKGTLRNSTAVAYIAAVDDISFLNCEKSYQPPALSACSCQFEAGLCLWVQGADDELDWLSRSGPTETPNTGPAGDHTTGKGKYRFIRSSRPSVKGNKAQLKSPLLPPAGENGYCFSLWRHMYGATVGSLRILLQTADSIKKTMVWQNSGNQGDEWQLLQIHVTMSEVHQLILEATVGGEAGDIAIDDISFISGLCPASDVCDFEEGSCGWQQETKDDFDWVRQSGPTLNPNTGPDSDHTTNTPTGHYYYLSSSAEDRAGQTAEMFTPRYPAGYRTCVQLWYHMYGGGMGILNVYQQTGDEKRILIFSQTGDQGQLWRFAQASLLPRVQPYRIVVEGVKAGPTLEGDMAFDDVQLTDAQCPPPGHCDFETNMCSWSNVGGGVDQEDWLRGRGASPNSNNRPSIDHTTNSSQGYYLYVDGSVGELGDSSFLISDVFQPSTRGHCLTFWYHMYGTNAGTLSVYINDRQMHTGGNEEGTQKWTETGNMGDKWQVARVPINHEQAFWFVFVYQRGRNAGGDVAIDDIAVLPGDCNSDHPDDKNDALSVGLAVGLTLLTGVIITIFLVIMNRNQCKRNQPAILHDDAMDQNSAFYLYDCKLVDTPHGKEADFSFFNNLYDPSSRATEGTVASSEA